MSVTIEGLETATAAGPPGADAPGLALLPWLNIGLGALVLGSYLVIAASIGSPWMVLIGPFVLLGSSRVMGLRPIWRGASGADGRGGVQMRSPLDTALQGAGNDQGSARPLAPSLESAIMEEDPASAIEGLRSALSGSKQSDPRTAYALGRQYMRVGRYAEARDWLRRAIGTGVGKSLPVALAESYVDQCNLALLGEGDEAFASGDFHGARERYARVSLGLESRELRRFALFLRSACVYSALQDYDDARQAVLQALQLDENGDDGLALLELLRQASGPAGATDRLDHDLRRVDQMLSRRAQEVMSRLRVDKGR